MPTYDYVCDACHDRFEHYQGISEPVLLTCRECGKRKLRRLIGSGAGILFKGSGFYETDYKRASGASGKPRKDDEASGDGAPATGGGKQDKAESGGDTPSKAPAEKKPSDGGKAGPDGKPGKG